MLVRSSSESVERRYAGNHSLQGLQVAPVMAPSSVSRISPLGSKLGVAEKASPIVFFIKRVIDPAAVATTLYVPAVLLGEWESPVFYNGVIAAVLSNKVLNNRLLFLQQKSLRAEVLPLLGRWLLLLAFLFCIGLFAGVGLSKGLLLIWLIAAPCLFMLGHAAIYFWLRHQSRRSRERSSVVIVGMTAAGCALAEFMQGKAMLRASPHGFFDDRLASRHGGRGPVLGRIADVADYVREHRVHEVYITLPMTAQPRVLNLVEGLKDTTASVYFVPDTLVFDLIQGRVDHVEGIPIIAICDSPLIGMSGVIKRCFDIVVASLGLLACAPLLLLIAAVVKLTSPGPVIFSQRRYGLNGEVINVHKFRTMTVLENGDKIRQVTRGDGRLTPVGRFLRKTSLDELPQLINVLNGSMSLIGPRPHATAHNELYRRLIDGYMLRHKVRPGITGWAQVNGFRGPTETVELMEQRVRLDLDYLRHWSFWLDLKILLRTVLTVWKDKNAC